MSSKDIRKYFYPIAKGTSPGDSLDKFQMNTQENSPNKTENQLNKTQKQMEDLVVDEDIAKHFPVTFQDFIQYTNISEIVAEDVKRNKKHLAEQYLNDKAYLERLAHKCYLNFYIKHKYRRIPPLIHVKANARCPSQMKQQLFRVPKKPRKKHSILRSVSTSKDLVKAINNNHVFGEADGNESCGNKGGSDIRSHSVKGFFKDSLAISNPKPPSFKQFMKFVDFEEDFQNYIKNLVQHGSTNNGEQVRKEYELLIYKKFYTSPDVRKSFKWKLRPCPRLVKEHILTETPLEPSMEFVSSGHNSGTSPLEVNNLEKKPSSNFNYPVSFETFKAYTFYEDIVNEICKEVATKSKRFKESEFIEEEKNKVLCDFYQDFYKSPEIRERYKIRLKPCPKPIKDLILKIPGELSRGEGVEANYFISKATKKPTVINQMYTEIGIIRESKKLSLKGIILESIPPSERKRKLPQRAIATLNKTSIKLDIKNDAIKKEFTFSSHKCISQHICNNFKKRIERKNTILDLVKEVIMESSVENTDPALLSHSDILEQHTDTDKVGGKRHVSSECDNAQPLKRRCLETLASEEYILQENFPPKCSRQKLISTESGKKFKNFAIEKNYRDTNKIFIIKYVHYKLKEIFKTRINFISDLLKELLPSKDTREHTTNVGSSERSITSGIDNDKDENKIRKLKLANLEKVHTTSNNSHQISYSKEKLEDYNDLFKKKKISGDLETARYARNQFTRYIDYKLHVLLEEKRDFIHGIIKKAIPSVESVTLTDLNISERCIFRSTETQLALEHSSKPTQEITELINSTAESSVVSHVKEALVDYNDFLKDKFFIDVDKNSTLSYAVRRSRDHKRRVIRALMTMTAKEFAKYTRIRDCRDNIYKDKEVLDKCFEYVLVNQKIWPPVLYMRQQDIRAYFHTKELVLDNFNFEDISPKFVDWDELSATTNFDEIVAHDYFKETGTQLNNALLADRREHFYTKCWAEDEWLWRVPTLYEKGLKARTKRSGVSQEKQKIVCNIVEIFAPRLVISKTRTNFPTPTNNLCKRTAPSVNGMRYEIVQQVHTYYKPTLTNITDDLKVKQNETPNTLLPPSPNILMSSIGSTILTLPTSQMHDSKQGGVTTCNETKTSDQIANATNVTGCAIQNSLKTKDLNREGEGKEKGNVDNNETIITKIAIIEKTQEPDFENFGSTRVKKEFKPLSNLQFCEEDSCDTIKVYPLPPEVLTIDCETEKDTYENLMKKFMNPLKVPLAKSPHIAPAIISLTDVSMSYISEAQTFPSSWETNAETGGDSNNTLIRHENDGFTITFCNTLSKTLQQRTESKLEDKQLMKNSGTTSSSSAYHTKPEVILTNAYLTLDDR